MLTRKAELNNNMCGCSYKNSGENEGAQSTVNTRKQGSRGSLNAFKPKDAVRMLINRSTVGNWILHMSSCHAIATSTIIGTEELKLSLLTVQYRTSIAWYTQSVIGGIFYKLLIIFQLMSNIPSTHERDELSLELQEPLQSHPYNL